MSDLLIPGLDFTGRVLTVAGLVLFACAFASQLDRSVPSKLPSKRERRARPRRRLSDREVRRRFPAIANRLGRGVR